MNELLEKIDVLKMEVENLKLGGKYGSRERDRTYDMLDAADLIITMFYESDNVLNLEGLIQGLEDRQII